MYVPVKSTNPNRALPFHFGVCWKSCIPFPVICVSHSTKNQSVLNQSNIEREPVYYSLLLLWRVLFIVHLSSQCSSLCPLHNTDHTHTPPQYSPSAFTLSLKSVQNETATAGWSINVAPVSVNDLLHLVNILVHSSFISKINMTNQIA